MGWFDIVALGADVDVVVLGGRVYWLIALLNLLAMIEDF